MLTSRTNIKCRLKWNCVRPQGWFSAASHSTACARECGYVRFYARDGAPEWFTSTLEACKSRNRLIYPQHLNRDIFRQVSCHLRCQNKSQYVNEPMCCITNKGLMVWQGEIKWFSYTCLWLWPVRSPKTLSSFKIHPPCSFNYVCVTYAPELNQACGSPVPTWLQ